MSLFKNVLARRLYLYIYHWLPLLEIKPRPLSHGLLQGILGKVLTKHMFTLYRCKVTGSLLPLKSMLSIELVIYIVNSDWAVVFLPLPLYWRTTQVNFCWDVSMLCLPSLGSLLKSYLGGIGKPLTTMFSWLLLRILVWSRKQFCGSVSPRELNERDGLLVFCRSHVSYYLQKFNLSVLPHVASLGDILIFDQWFHNYLELKQLVI